MSLKSVDKMLLRVFAFALSLVFYSALAEVEPDVTTPIVSSLSEAKQNIQEASTPSPILPRIECHCNCPQGSKGDRGIRGFDGMPGILGMQGSPGDCEKEGCLQIEEGNIEAAVSSVVCPRVETQSCLPGFPGRPGQRGFPGPPGYPGPKGEKGMDATNCNNS